MLAQLYHWHELWSPLNVFQYITFRMGGSFLTALFIMLALGSAYIRFLKKWELTQSIREYGPKSHLVKSGTPTMGGLLILLALVVATVLWARLDNRYVLLTLISAVYLGALGFFDDYRKLILKHPAKGLSQITKMGFQLLWALGVVTYLYFDPPNMPLKTTIQIPYLKEMFVNLNSLIILLGLMVLVGASNAVNLTDGLDGLVGGVLLINALTFALFVIWPGTPNCLFIFGSSQSLGRGSCPFIWRRWPGRVWDFFGLTVTPRRSSWGTPDPFSWAAPLDWWRSASNRS